MLMIDREEFIAFTRGTLLDFRFGIGIAINEALCEQAEREAQEGKEVGLMVDNKPFSTLQLIGDIIFELPVPGIAEDICSEANVQMTDDKILRAYLAMRKDTQLITVPLDAECKENCTLACIAQQVWGEFLEEENAA